MIGDGDVADGGKIRILVGRLNGLLQTRINIIGLGMRDRV